MLSTDSRTILETTKTYIDLGEFEKTEQCLNHALEISEKNFDIGASINGLIFNGFGMLFYNQGEYKKAEHCFLQSLEITIKVFGKDHSSVKTMLNNLENARGALLKQKEESLHSDIKPKSKIKNKKSKKRR